MTFFEFTDKQISEVLRQLKATTLNPTRCTMVTQPPVSSSKPELSVMSGRGAAWKEQNAKDSANVRAQELEQQAFHDENLINEQKKLLDILQEKLRKLQPIIEARLESDEGNESLLCIAMAELESNNAELRKALHDTLQSHCDGYDLWLYKYQSLLPDSSIIGEQECCLPKRNERIAENERLRKAFDELSTKEPNPLEVSKAWLAAYENGVILVYGLRDAMEGKDDGK
jgi:hypothetical protein